VVIVIGTDEDVGRRSERTRRAVVVGVAAADAPSLAEAAAVVVVTT